MSKNIVTTFISQRNYLSEYVKKRKKKNKPNNNPVSIGNVFSALASMRACWTVEVD